MTKDQQIQAEAAAFRALVAHLQQRTDVQNIDLMTLAGFCRNCLSKWYSAEVKKMDPDFDYSDAGNSKTTVTDRVGNDRVWTWHATKLTRTKLQQKSNRNVRTTDPTEWVISESAWS